MHSVTTVSLTAMTKAVHENDGGYSGSADRGLGPNPASMSALSTPAFDTSDAIGMTMTFKYSYQFYYRWEGSLP